MTTTLIVGNFIILTCLGRRVAFNVQNIVTVRDATSGTEIITAAGDGESYWQVDESFGDVVLAITGDES